jgi:hypothetical protein
MRPIVIAVSIGHNSEAGKVIPISEDLSGFHPISGVPDRESVTKQVFGRSGDFELNLKFPVSRSNRLEEKLIKHFKSNSGLALTLQACLVLL